MKTWLKWFVFNALFVAFFLCRDLLPPFIFNGGYFLIWIITILGIIVFLLSIAIYIITEGDAEYLDSARRAFEENRKSDLYYKVDLYFDIFMLFVLGGLGYYAYAVFYAMVSVLLILFRNLLIDN